ncbi:peptide chain release factor N(5)-glutamine methyltransferase [Cupriavidus sp. AU9028]|uniref:peptide chain release factor N(5)-glutamine methyltransferase n=1 Tax=Cupriavidus sp. AU9028 TaxID=2871157 RepID=UPI001C95628E|nr:peptide chain release factor N(5)-glutamine methyltransferase [Cupriavidus sp. AU9028]MBY4898277.1 peptide chain release factor N(5)-glutamine methyltransferase [Cupriavidus sp. AU9028]
MTQHPVNPPALPDSDPLAGNPTLTVRDALRWVAGAGLPVLEARMLVGLVTGLTRTQLITRDADVLDHGQQQRLTDLVRRRLAGEPMAYLTGEREFYGRPFRVGPGVLIPRPDTEVVVQRALACLEGRHAPRVLDLGTGSGILAITLACERPDALVWATDISPAALEIARENAGQLGAQVSFLLSDWYGAVPAQRFDLIVSNPPYIAAGDPHLGQGDLRFEPVDALTDHADGLTDLRTIAAGALSRLEAGGWLLLEHGHDQGAAARELLATAGFEAVFTERDLGDNERCTGGRAPAEAPRALS